MTSPARIQDRVYYGYAQAAKRLGYPHDVYRPTSQVAPMSTVLLTLPISFNSRDFKYMKTSVHGDPNNYGVFDGRLTQPGDILKGGNGDVYFIASQELDLPILCVQANRWVSIQRQATQGGAVGAVAYSGQCDDTALVIAGAAGATPTSGMLWPASILLGGRSASRGPIVSGTREEGFRVLLPSSLTGPIKTGDVVVDDLGVRYLVEGAELTRLGWRLACVQAHL